MRGDLDKLRALVAVLESAPMWGKAAAAESALRAALDLLAKIIDHLQKDDEHGTV